MLARATYYPCTIILWLRYNPLFSSLAFLRYSPSTPLPQPPTPLTILRNETVTLFAVKFHDCLNEKVASMSPRLCIGIGGKETKRDRTVRRGGCLLSFPFSSYHWLLPFPSFIHFRSFICSYIRLFFCLLFFLFSFFLTRFLTNC